jgi:hypothetical protein
VLEQRISRAHRMGQMQPVQVFVLVTEGTLEEGLLRTLSLKRELALAALDPESNVEAVNLTSGAEELKARLEVLLGAKPEALIDKTVERDETAAAREQRRRERVAAAGGEMLGAVFHFLGELVGDGENGAPPAEPVVRDVAARFNKCVEVDETGRARLTVTFPNQQALEGLARTLARMMAGKEE